MTLATGTCLDAYTVVAPLGTGGMGEVYRARDGRLGRDVALKVIAGKAVGDPEALALFEREARTLATLSHPNILSIFDFGRTGGHTYAVMELLEGAPSGSASGAGRCPGAPPPRSAWPSPRGWPRPTPRGSCTGTSSRRTSSCRPTGR